MSTKDDPETYPVGIRLLDISGSNRTFTVGAKGVDDLDLADGSPVKGRDVFEPLAVRDGELVLELVPDMLDPFTIKALDGRKSSRSRYGDRS